MLFTNELLVRSGDIISNYSYFNSLKRAAAVVKADAYGLGMESVCGILSKVGVQEFYTFSLSEAIDLRKFIGSSGVIYFFSGLLAGEHARIASEHRLVPILNRLDELFLWQEVSWAGAKPLCVFVDTGMNRLGLAMEEWQDFCNFYKSYEGEFSPPLILSHLACADDIGHEQNSEQLRRIRSILSDIPRSQLSLSATSGSFLGSDYLGDQLRIGIGLYGIVPPFSRVKLRNPLTWLSHIMRLRRVQAGETIGYGASFIEGSKTVAIISCGYADGLARGFSSSGRLYVHGVGCPFLGRISMDSCAIDVTGVRVEVGDRVEIFGKHQPLQVVANSMDTIAYEVLCGIGDRVKRKFIE